MAKSGFSGEDLGEQQVYIKRVAETLKNRKTEVPRACVTTYGCQQNVSDSQHIKGLLLEMGYELTDSPDGADFILFNTCAVREHAEDRVWGNVGAMKKFKEKNPSIILAVCGCMVQQKKNADRFLKSYPYVDIIFGTQVSHRLPEFIYRRLSGERRICELTLDNGDLTEGVPFYNDGGIKGFVPIMYGCDNFCSYCIVPYVRGRERSRNSAAVIEDIKKLVSEGVKEIMLLGQNVNSYGKGLSEDINFAKLLRLADGVPGDFRIRFMTSNPKDCTAELLDSMRDCKKVERHLHLPFQSGSDTVLKRMNRKYTVSGYLDIIAAARERMPDITFTSDIIVGFPDESEEDFEGTLALVRKVGFSALFTFIYSKREGTPAAIMPDGVTREQKGVRFDRLLRTQEEMAKKVLDSMVGRTVRVLCEEYYDGFVFGKDEHGLNVKFEGEDLLVGDFADVKIISAGDILTGEMIKQLKKEEQKMTVIEAARILGEAIQGDERFLRYAKAKLANDKNDNLQELIGKFNVVRMNLDEVMTAEERDESKVQELNEELRKVYTEIMSDGSMVEYDASKVDLDTMLNEVNSIIMQCVDGADPKTVEPELHSCTGSCESCGGCH